jgi:hypothetical protein
MKVEPNELEKALADKCAALVKAGHDPEQVALAALDMACGARGPPTNERALRLQK